MTIDMLLANFERLAEAPNGIPKLRELILHLAVRGKLVPQDPDDEPASELLKKIQAEKQRLVKAGVVRKSREPGDVAAEDELYHIPPSWEWVRLAHVGSIVGGGTPRASDSANFASNGIPWVTPADMRGLKGKYVSRGSRDLSKAGLQNSSATLMPPGTVLFSSRAPIGYVAIAENGISTNQGFKSVVPYVAEMSEYIHCFLASAADEIDRNASGTTFREISGKGMSIVRVSVPPLAEQKRIVAKVDELMALCDELEAKQQAKRTKQIALNRASLHALTRPNKTSLASAWHRVRDHFDDLYTAVPETVAELRQTIIQLAVMGRLVPQDPNDEPARKLSMDDLVGRKRMKNGLSLKETSETTPYRCLRLSALRNGAVDCDDAKPIAFTEDRAAQYLVEKGDVFVVRGNGSKDLVGRAGLVECQPVGLIFPDLFIRIPLDSSGLLARYFLIAWNSPETRRTIEGLAKTTSGIWKVNQGHVASIALRVPSLPQQERIASKVDQLMRLCEDLKSKLQEAQTDADNLLTAIVHELTEAAEGIGAR
jgi:type I restriction enzyme S subunit